MTYTCHLSNIHMINHALNVVLKTQFNSVVDRLKNSKTDLPDLYNCVQMDEKTTKNAKIMKILHSLSRYWWICLTGGIPPQF